MMVLNSYTLSIYKEQGPFLSISNREVKMLTIADICFLLFSFTPVKLNKYYIQEKIIF